MAAERVRVIAHRGARLLAAENTLEALRVAFEEGADGVEFDVQLTRDGEPVLFHDDLLTDLTGAAGRLVDQRWKDLRRLTVRDRHGHKGRIPHLSEALELFEGRTALLNLELKVVAGNGPWLTDAVVRALLAAPRDGWLLTSFDRAALTRLAGTGVELPRGLLIDADPSCDWWSAATPGPHGAVAVSEAARAVGGHLTAIHPHGGLLNPDRLELWRAAGFDVNPWTLNQPSHWRAAVELGASGIITDDPGGLVRHLGRVDA